MKNKRKNTLAAGACFALCVVLVAGAMFARDELKRQAERYFAAQLAKAVVHTLAYSPGNRGD